MPSLKYVGYRAAFELLWASRLPGLIRKFSRCRGVIFTLHRVLPQDPADFSPNAILQIKPDFLEYAITRVRELGLETVDLDEALRRIESPVPEKPFAAFTFDDAYRDNLKFALPLMRRLQCPFALYVPTALADGVGEVWWQALEDIIAAQPAIAVTYAGETEYFPTATTEQKYRTYDSMYWRMRAMPEPDRVALIRELADQYGLDLAAHCRELIMDWSDLRVFAVEQLCTLGAHTVHHFELAKLATADARNEIEQSMRVMKAQFGVAPIHFSYPIGSPSSAGPRDFQIAKELGLRSGVTTRPGGIYAHHRDSLHSLPRISLNGLFQERRYLDVFATGALFSMVPGGFAAHGVTELTTN